MEILFAIFVIVWTVFNIPWPLAGGVGTTKFVIGILAIVLVVLLVLQHRVA